MRRSWPLTAGVPGPVIRWQYSARVSRISSADLVHVNGLGSLFHSLIHLRMSVSSWATLRWAERRSLRLVSAVNCASINRPWEISAVMSGSGLPGEPLEVGLDAGDDA